MEDILHSGLPGGPGRAVWSRGGAEDSVGGKGAALRELSRLGALRVTCGRWRRGLMEGLIRGSPGRQRRMQTPEAVCPQQGAEGKESELRAPT